MADKIKSNLTQDDFYGWTENQLLLSGRLAGNVITLDPLSNDSPGNGKTLFSIDDGNGHTNLTDYDLLNADRNGVWESTSTGNRIRIINGKVEVDVGHSLAVLGATNVNSLRAGEHIHDEFVYALQAGNNGNLSQAKITVDIYGENDAASIAGDSSRDVAEHATVPVTGTLTVTDADHGESHTQTVTNAVSDNHLGTYSVDADGHWSYVVNNDAVKHLNANETATDTFTVFSLDHTASQQVTITIHGENDADAPLVTTPDASGSTGGNIELHITVTKTDPTETLGNVEIEGVPSGYALTAGTELHAGLWLVSVSDLPELALTPVGDTSPGEFVLHVTATSSDGTSTASTSADLDVTIEAAAGTQSGRVVDGYIAGATVFADADNDGTLDAGEAHTTTNADGSFTLTGGSGPLVMFGGTDVSTGLTFDGVMTAPSGSTVVTPLTTLVVQLAATMSLAAAQDAVAAAFGLDTSINLQTFDPVPAAVTGDTAALAILSAAIQVQTTITQISAVAGTTDDVVAAIAAAITAANGGTVDLSQSAVVEGIATQAGVGANAIEAVKDVVSAANASAQDATNVTELAQTAQVAQGEATDALATTNFNDAGQVATLTQTYVSNLETQVAAAQVWAMFDDEQQGTLGDDTLTGDRFLIGARDRIDGLDGRDQIDGKAGDDVLYGGAGYDTLTGGTGDDLIDGGSGIDRAIYTDATGPITVDMAAGTVDGGASVGHDTLVSVEQIRATATDDTYVATGYAGASFVGSLPPTFNEFEGMGGNDVITGNGGTLLSYLSATNGVNVNFASWVAGQGASGTASGDASVGTDNFTGVQGVRGSDFDDTLHGSNNVTGVEVFQGRAGDDTIDGGGGFDRALYWFRTDDNVTGGITVNMAAGTVVGDASVGSDTLRSVEAVRATNFVDTYNATGFTTTASVSAPNAGSAGFFQIGSFQAAFNEFEGFGSNDSITGNGNTRIDYINATAAVTVDLQAGWATGDVSVGTDTIVGGVNSIQGSYYADTLYGSNNAPNTTESYDGGAGDDTIDGRGGFDQAYYNNAIATVFGIDVDMGAGTVDGDASIGHDTLRSIESVRGTNFADTYDATGFGQPGALNIGNSATFNSFEGLAGNDTITGNGNTQLTFFNAGGGVTVSFSTGTVTGDASVGTDHFTGVNNVQGSNFNDTIIGTAGNQTFGGRGGADTFVYADNGGADVVSDFSHGQGDKIDLTGVTGIYDLADVQAIAAQLGPNTRIDFGGGNTLTLNNVTATNLAASDFIFAPVNHIVGDNNDNILVGTPSPDWIEGLGGHDTLQGLAGDDVLDGGSEIDRAIYTNATDGITVDLAAGTAHGTAPGDLANVGTDTLVSIEQIGGSNFDDTYVATGYTGVSPVGSLQASFNEFEGMAGDDIITGNGSTILLYLNANDGVTVNFTSWVAGQGASGSAIGDASVGTDTFTGVQGVRGSEFDDTFHGSNQLTGVEVFQGRGGNDWIDGGGGFDRSNYWFRTDDNVTGGITVNLAAGTVVGDASVGTDTLRSIESVRATNFDDTYNAAGFTTTTSVSAPNAGNAGSLLIGSFQAAFNEFEGFDGDDSITGNGNTRIDYINATAAVTVDLAAGTAQGTAAGDIANVGLDTFSGVNSVQGSYFNDTLYGSNNVTLTTESFDGGAGNDFIDGRGGFDQAYYTNAIGTVQGIDVTVTTDTVAGDAFQVVGDASIGIDTLIAIESVRGTNFVDTFDATGYNGASTDVLPNGPHFNEFEGLGGNDVITGNGVTGLGATRISYVSATAGVTVDLAAGIASGDASVGTDTITGGVNRVRGSNFNDTLSGDADDNILEGQNGNDILNGRGGNDILTGGANSDTFVYTDNGGADIVTDFFHAQADKINLIDVTGVDSLAAVQGIATQAGAHTVLDFGGGNTLTLNNVTAANLTASDFIFADNNDNILLGVPASETLAGLGGNDTLTGGGGNDTLSGGLGADHFHYDAPTDGLDQILDFNTAEGDLVEVLGAAFGGLSTGTLDPSLFSTQTDGSFDNTTERFSFDQVSHTLYYDGDGSDAGSTAVAIAQFATGVNITNHEINVV